MIKKTKIIATLGPASSDKHKIEKMILGGVDIFRLNFSHGLYKDHQKNINLIHFLSKKFKKPIAILADLCGPKIRIGDFLDGKIELKHNQKFILTTEKCIGNQDQVFINYKNITKEAKPGQIVLLDDGKIELRIDKIFKNKLICHVVFGGELTNRKGVNFPQTSLKISSLTEKDKQDLKFITKNKIDFIALSFIRTVNDILELKNILKKLKSDIEIIAKIETKEAVKNIDQIIKEAYGIMVARGDLAVEVGVEQVPIIQKNIVKQCNDLGKPVIIATQMLESMIKNPVPTRAEVSDVANAILDGADAIMLSAETASGNFPVKSIEVMSRVAKHIEQNFDYQSFLKNYYTFSNIISDSVSFAVSNLAYNINAKVIVALTETGYTPQMITRFRIKQPILALTPNKNTYNKLALVFGCFPFIINPFKNIEEVREIVKNIVLKNNFAKKGEKIVICAGIPFGKAGATNFLMGEVL